VRSTIRTSALVWLATLATTVGVGLGVGADPALTAAVLVGAGYVGALFLVAPERLPAVVLLATALAPTAYLPLPPVARVATPAVAATVVWLIRTRSSPIAAALPRWFVMLAAATVLWLCVKTADSINPLVSTGWSALFAVLVVGLGCSAERSTSLVARYLTTTWLALAVALGAYAAAEALTGYNPLSVLYAQADYPIVQRWSVFRVTTTLGHPLNNGLFFGVTAAVATMMAADTARSTRTRWWAGGAAGASVVALILTVSRSAAVGLVVGLAVGLLLLVASSRRGSGSRVVLGLVVVLVATAVSRSPLIALRSSTAEGLSSVGYRDAVTSEALQVLAYDHYVGSGAGTSQQRFSSLGIDLVVENSALQLAVSIGLGAVVVAVLVLATLASMVRRRRFECAAGLTTFVTIASGFNVIETNPAALALVGLLVLLAWSPSDLPTPVHGTVSEPSAAVAR
jgi:hypothetical protein